MRKLATLLLAAAMLLGTAGQSLAVDFQIKGRWQFAFDYINGGNFMGKTAPETTPSGSNGPPCGSNATH